MEPPYPIGAVVPASSNSSRDVAFQTDDEIFRSGAVARSWLDDFQSEGKHGMGRLPPPLTQSGSAHLSSAIHPCPSGHRRRARPHRPLAGRGRTYMVQEVQVRPIVHGRHQRSLLHAHRLRSGITLGGRAGGRRRCRPGWEAAPILWTPSVPAPDAGHDPRRQAAAGGLLVVGLRSRSGLPHLADQVGKGSATGPSKLPRPVRSAVLEHP